VSEQNPERCYKRLCIGMDDMHFLLNGRFTLYGLPDGYEIRYGYVDQQSNACVFMLFHPDFDPVDPSMMPPVCMCRKQVEYSKEMEVQHLTIYVDA
jgi:hypothetical protein